MILFLDGCKAQRLVPRVKVDLGIAIKVIPRFIKTYNMSIEDNDGMHSN